MNTITARAAVADHRTSLIRNCWYVAALASDVGRTLLARKILGINMVLYRTTDGQAVALHDRCVHRSFPLSRGRLDGDDLVCGYHSMQYRPDGTCSLIPTIANTPASVRLPTFALVERGPLLWVWPGDQNPADPADIPDLSWLDDAAWRNVGGAFHMRSNYVAMHENLLDQTHFTYLHAGSVGTPDYARAPLSMRVEGDQVWLRKELSASAAPGIYGIPMGLENKLVDRRSDAGFRSPACHIAHATITDLAPPPAARSAYHVNIVHLITPETQDSFHYWWFNSRDFALHDDAVSTFLRDASMQAYHEDVDALTWIHQRATDDALDFAEQSFGPDRPGLAMRRILHRLAEPAPA